MGWGLRISVLECCVHSCPWKLLGTGTRGLSAGDGTAGALFSPPLVVWCCCAMRTPQVPQL